MITATLSARTTLLPSAVLLYLRMPAEAALRQYRGPQPTERHTPQETRYATIATDPRLVCAAHQEPL